MKTIKNSMLFCVVVILFSTILTSYTYAATTAIAQPVATTMTQQQKADLISKLVAMLTQLQAQLKAMQTSSVTPTAAPALITADDYMKGASNAKIQILTFTDFDCPYCKVFHSTINEILNDNKDVSVVYRHYPIEMIHPNAKELAIAVECAGQVSGDAAFWSFADQVFASRDINEQTDMSSIPTLAQKVGIPSTPFSSCRTSSKASAAVEADMSDGNLRGVTGTPQSFIYKDGKVVATISGAQPFTVVQNVINQLLQQ